MTTTSKGASSMAELMARKKSTFVSLNKGQTVTGTVTKLTPSEILLDINAKTEAVVLEKEKHLVKVLLSLLKIGDKVNASVLNPESDTGNPVVSLRRFIDETLWNRLSGMQKKGEKIDVVVKGQTKGGYLVETKEGIQGFLPNSHVSVKKESENLVGKTLSLMIAETNRETRKLIVSQKTVLGQADFDAIAKKLKKDEVIDAVVSHLTSFGIFVAIPVKDRNAQEVFLDGLIHISEVSWEKTTDLPSHFAVGDAIAAVVVGIDTNAKRIDLSIKRLTEDPFKELLKKYAPDQKVTGQVLEITPTGVVVNLGEEGIEGFIRKEKIPPTVNYKTGQEVEVTVVEVDSRKHRVLLTPVLLAKPLMYR